MNKFLSGVLAIVLSLGMGTVAFDAEAKRIGGGKSSGMQRQATPPKAPNNATPAQTPNAAPAAAGAAGAAGAAAKKSSWMGPIAGIAAGLGLAALASHLGFGEAFGNIMLIILAVVVVMAVVGFIMRKRAAQQGGGMAYAGAGAGAGGFNAPSSNDTFTQRQSLNNTGGSMIGSGIGANVGGQPAQATGNIPADFDVAGFVRNAKVNYIRLQAANDAGNLDDIRAFTTPEMFAEIQMDIADRGGKTQTTEVVQINAEVIDVAEEPALYIVSTRFTGTVREDGETVQVDEIWHLSKPRNGATGWVIAGIQQVQ